MAEHDLEKIVEAGGDVFNFRDPTKQPVADRVTSIRAASSATDTKYPSEKAVAKAVESASTIDKLYANQLWGGEFRTSQSPGDTYFFMQRNCFFGVKPSAVRVEYSTDGGTTWLDYGLTDTKKVELFSQYGYAAVVCGHNTHIQPGYTGTVPAGSTKDLTNEIIADQRLRITICTNSLAMEGASGTTDVWMYCTLKRIGIYMSTQSAGKGPTHCVFQGRTGANFIAGNDTWKTFGDYKIMGDIGWNSIPCSNATSQNGIVFGNTSSQYRELRFEIWSDSLSDSPASSQTGNLQIIRVVGFSELLWTNNSINPNMGRFGSPYSVNSSTGVANFSKGLTSGVAIPVGSGGTGKSSVTSGNYLVGNGTSALTEKTPKDAGSDVLKSLDTDNGDVVDGDYIVTSYHVDASTISSSTFVRRTAVKLWNYIKSKLSGSDVSIGGNAATAGTADTAKAFDTSFSGTNSIASALNGKSPTTHTHKTDAADVTSDDTNLGDAEDTMQFVTTDAAGYDSSHKPLYRRPAVKIWNWIKSKLASDTGYINFAHSVASATNVNSHVLAGVVFADNSLHSCMFTFVMAVTFNFRESDECGGILKVDVGIGTGGFYIKNISLSNVTGTLSVGDFNLVVGEVLNRKVVGVTWNGVLNGSRYLRGTILSRYVAGDDTEFMYNGDVANGATQAWSSARQWADDSAVVHIAGSETITGAKEFSRSGQDTNFTDSSGAESVVRARTATNSNNGSCQLDAYASGGKYGLYARNSGGAGKWVANLDNDGVVNLGSSGDAVRIGGTKFVFGSSQLGTDSNTFYWV